MKVVDPWALCWVPGEWAALGGRLASLWGAWGALGGPGGVPLGAWGILGVPWGRPWGYVAVAARLLEGP